MGDSVSHLVVFYQQKALEKVSWTKTSDAWKRRGNKTSKDAAIPTWGAWGSKSCCWLLLSFCCTFLGRQWKSFSSMTQIPHKRFRPPTHASNWLTTMQGNVRRIAKLCSLLPARLWLSFVLHVVLMVWQPLRASNVTARGLLKGYQMPWLTPWISTSSLRACLCARAAASPSSHHLLHIFPYLLLHSCTNPSLKPHLASEWLFERSCYIYLVTFHILHANHALLPSAHQLPAPPLAAQECCCYREVLRLILHPYRTPTAWQEPTRKHIIFMILLQLKRLSLCHFLELQNQVCF